MVEIFQPGEDVSLCIVFFCFQSIDLETNLSFCFRVIMLLYMEPKLLYFLSQDCDVCFMVHHDFSTFHLLFYFVTSFVMGEKFQTKIYEENDANRYAKNYVAIIFLTCDWFIFIAITFYHIITYSGNSFHIGVDLALAAKSSILIHKSSFHILLVTLVKMFIHRIVTVRMMIAFQIWMNADTDIVFGAMDVLRVGAGKASIARVTAGLPAIVRIPIVSGVVISYDFIKSATVVRGVSGGNIIYTRADSLIVFLNILVFCTGLIYGKDPVRQILAGKFG